MFHVPLLFLVSLVFVLQRTEAGFTRPTATATDFDGGSIAGLATAVALRPLKVCILERATKFRKVGALIALFPNGITALKSIGVQEEQVLESCVPLKSTQRKDLRDDLVREVPSPPTSKSRFLLWYELQQHLLNSLPQGSTTVMLGCTFDSVVQDEHGVVKIQYNSKENETHEMTCRVLVGADGIDSRVRNYVLTDPPPLRFHDRTTFRGVMEGNLLTNDKMPPLGVAVTYRCQDDSGKFFKLWNAGNGILSFTAACSTDSPGELGDANVNKAWLQRIFADYPLHLENVPADSPFVNHICDRDPCGDMWSKGNVVIVGDAAHAMVPALGQGGNVALEDACELAHVLLQQAATLDDDDDVAAALKHFSETRASRVGKIHEASRRQTRNKKNKGQSSLDEFMAKNPSFYKDLYEWKPSFASTIISAPAQ